MNISTLIDKLRTIQEEHGNLEVGILDNEWGESRSLSNNVTVQQNNYRENAHSCDDKELGKVYVRLQDGYEENI